jgi:Family of unknown function (DUF6056)
MLWLADPRLIAGGVLVLALIRAGIVVPAWPRHAPPWLRLALPVVLLAVLFALYALPYVALSGGIPRRTYGAIHFVFLCGGLIVLLAWSPAILALAPLRRLDPAQVLRCALVALALSLPMSRTVAAGALDLLGPAESYRAAMASRDAVLRQLHADGVREAVIPSVAAGTYPRSYVFNADIRAEPDFWVNRAVAAYYGLDTVRAIAGN